MVQILNYDHVLDHDIRSLPLIENETLRFERSYAPVAESGLLGFKTVLTVKNGGRIVENEVPLLPVRKNELDAVMRGAGFRELEWFGDFHGNPLGETSLPLICIASR
jgi:hypothetical protein